MELRSVAYNPTPAPNMGGMMQGMPGMQGMQGMHQEMQEMQGMNHEMHGMPGMQGMNQEMHGMPGMQGMNQEMPEMQPGMYQEMQGMHEMERMLHGMQGMPGAYPHFDYDPCCQMPCPPCSEPIMQPTCPMPMPTPLPAPTPTPAHEVYVVKPGDSVYKIAKRYGTTMQAIILANNLRNPDRIYPGEILYIPGASASKFRG